MRVIYGLSVRGSAAASNGRRRTDSTLIGVLCIDGGSICFGEELNKFVVFCGKKKHDDLDDYYRHEKDLRIAVGGVV